MFASRITRAAPRTFPVMMRLMKPGTSIRVGQAIVQGASKQYRHREASINACRAFIGGEISAKFFSYCSGVSFVAVSRRGKYAPRAFFWRSPSHRRATRPPKQRGEREAGPPGRDGAWSPRSGVL